tara:strand:+ start:277 stop:507 length:231 start_codon:yes stop_codon:yes gene_type:complete
MADKRYDSEFKIDYQTESKKAELHTGKDTHVNISLIDDEVLIEDGKGDSLTIALDEASMFHQALIVLIKAEKGELV